MSLRVLTQELTEPHLKMRGQEVTKRPAKISELRLAITHSNGEGGDTSAGKPLPLDGQALQLLMDMERMAGEDHQNRYEERYFGTLEGLIAKIGKDDHSPEWESWFNQIFQEWADRIDALIRPTKVRRLDGISCPACGLSRHGEDNETCLIIRCYEEGTKDLSKVSEWSAECRGCSAQWSGDTMKYLLAVIAQGC